MNMGKEYRKYSKSLLLVLVAAGCLLAAVFGPSRVVQATAAKPEQQVFSGEYSFDGENWQELTEHSDLRARRGELLLRGHFLHDIPEGMILNYMTDHIGVAICLNGELWTMNVVAEVAQMGIDLPTGACGRSWEQVISPGITAEDDIEIYLTTHHRFGNENAYRYFLDTLYNCGNQFNRLELQESLQAQGNRLRGIATFFAVSALMLLGAVTAAAVLRVKETGRLLNMGLMTLFAAGFYAFDAIDAPFWSEKTVLNTYVLQLCAMLFVYCLGSAVVNGLSGKRKRVADVAMTLSGAVNIVLFTLSICGAVLIYDTKIVWGISQLVLLPLLAVCCILELCRGKDEPRLSLVSGIVLSATVLLDLAGVAQSVYSQGTCTKLVFPLVFLAYIVETAKEIIRNQQASALAERLKKEVESSRTAIMLSQIKPHFLHNSLGVIQELCHSEPLAAEDAIGNFAQYLKGNMGALESDELIPFKKELEHAECYLEIEKLRFGDQLNVEIKAEDVRIKLPALTIQPLVENAVRHGVRKREESGTVTISATEYPDRCEVVIEDDGPGFDPTEPQEDGKLHVGIANVRQRLQRMCGGELRIDSAPGEGTRAIIILPKEGEPC